MAISKKIQDALQGQVNAEFFAAYLYLAMSAHLQERHLPGAAKWMRTQAKEEVGHALKILDHIHDRGGRVSLDEVPRPSTGWKTVLDVFEDSLGHERKVTGKIHALVDLAVKENDHATASFLQWFVDEQVEEERQVEEIVARLQMIGDDPRGLLFVDRELGARES